MRVAELFINLGLKGQDKTVTTLGTVNGTLKTIGETAVETKLALVGIFYELERLTSQSNAFGLALKQFNDFTGLSSEKLQRWQYLMRQSGVSAEETQSTIESLQKSVGKILTNQGQPGGITAISNIVGLDLVKLKDKNGPLYLLEKLREYLRHTKGDNLAVVNEIASTFALGPKVIAALRTSDIDLNKIKPSEIFNDREVSTLARMAIGWANLGKHIELAIGRLNVKFGPRLLQDLTKLTEQVLSLVTALGRLAEQLNVIAGIGKILNGFTWLTGKASQVASAFTSPEFAAARNEDFTPGVGFLPHKGGLFPQPNTSNNTTNQTVNNNISTTVGGLVGAEVGAESLGRTVSKEIARAVNDAMRQLPQVGY